MKTITKRSLGVGALVVSFVLLISVTSLGAQQSNTLPALSLTQRPTAEPWTPTPKSTPVSVSYVPEGALIWLCVKFDPVKLSPDLLGQDMWTVVQWQDGLGQWHVVEGWRGELDKVAHGKGRKVWWLSGDLFEKGPFRWLIYAKTTGTLLATSEPFTMPSYNGEVTYVDLLIEP
jgi:hypothetical protein